MSPSSSKECETWCLASLSTTESTSIGLVRPSKTEAGEEGEEEEEEGEEEEDEEEGEGGEMGKEGD